ncbi:type IV secretion system protein [Bartonella raoultii]|uniref:type IV secretion system protein n=1 Tax=Bartonella raoultii TaxID=1457020 RepID=UPI00280BD9A6|nr:type IV secretion system protein [Bartonella raoultii]
MAPKPKQPNNWNRVPINKTVPIEIQQEQHVKKLFIIAVISVFLGIPTSAISKTGSSTSHTSLKTQSTKKPNLKSLSNISSLNKIKKPKFLIDQNTGLIKQQYTTNKKQLKPIKKIHQFINKSKLKQQKKNIKRKKSAHAQNNKIKKTFPDDYLMNQIMNYKMTSYKKDQKQISQELQNTIAFGEDISRKSFAMAHNRFEALKKLVEKIKDTNDLKSLAEVQASIDFLFTAIQNETIKFQATTHSYKSQKALINQRKQQLYATVFSHTNTHMPSLQSITKKF